MIKQPNTPGRRWGDTEMCVHPFMHLLVFMCPILKCFHGSLAIFELFIFEISLSTPKLQHVLKSGCNAFYRANAGISA